MTKLTKAQMAEMEQAKEELRALLPPWQRNFDHSKARFKVWHAKSYNYQIYKRWSIIRPRLFNLPGNRLEAK